MQIELNNQTMIVITYKDFIENKLFCFGVTKQQIDKSKISVFPFYQRNYVYNINQESSLINSLLGGITLNPIQVLEYEKDGIKYREVLDGTQRLNVIKRFIDEEFSITLDDKTVKFSDLDEDNKNKLNVFCCITKKINNTDDACRRFVLFNTSSSKLTPPELWSSKYIEYGGFVKFKRLTQEIEFKELYSRLFYGENNLTWYDIRNKRNQLLFDTISMFSLKSHRNRETLFTGNLIKYTEAYIERVLANDNRTYDDFKREFLDDLKLLEEIFRHSRFKVRETKWFKDNEVQNNHKLLLITLGLSLKYIKNPRDAKNYATDIINIYKEVCLAVKEKKIYDDHRGRSFHTESSKFIEDKLIDLTVTELKRRGKFKLNDINEKLKTQDNKCNICETEFNDNVQYEADHIKPVSKGGLTRKDNLQLLCKTCNNKKSNKTLEIGK